MKFSHSFVVPSGDIDEQGHVNNVAYVRWIQEVAVAHWMAVTAEETRQRFTWVLTRHEVDYRRQTFESETVTATTWVGRAKRITCERFTEIDRDGEKLVTARSTWCLIDRATGRPVRIPDFMVEVFQMQTD